MHAKTEAKDAYARGLVEGDPILDPVTEEFKALLRVGLEVTNKLP